MNGGRVGDWGLTAEGPSGRAAGWLSGCIITGELNLGTRLLSGDSQSLELGSKGLIPSQELDSGRSHRAGRAAPGLVTWGRPCWLSLWGLRLRWGWEPSEPL